MNNVLPADEYCLMIYSLNNEYFVCKKCFRKLNFRRYILEETNLSPPYYTCDICNKNRQAIYYTKININKLKGIFIKRLIDSKPKSKTILRDLIIANLGKG